MASTSGHVFVTRGDIRRQACDAWLIPCECSGRVEPSWVAWPARAAERLGPPLPFPHWSREARRVRCLEGWPTHLPEPWLLHVEVDASVPSSWVVEGMASFVRAAAKRQAGRRPSYGRTVPLFAVPVGVAGIGAADGLAAQRAAGSLVQELLPELRDAARDGGVDVVIVAHSDSSLAAAQVAREQEGGTDWEGLPSALQDHLPELAQAVARHELVLLLGPALGQRVGLPSWGRLLERLAEAGCTSARWRDALSVLPEDARTEMVVRAVGNAAAFGTAAAERLGLPHHGLAHGLAASLRPDPIFCHTPDDLLDQALAAAGLPPDIIVDGPVHAGGSRMLKLLGSPSAPPTLLWARVDPAWRRERTSCVRALVQAAGLVHPQILAIGFSPGPLLLQALSDVCSVLPPGKRASVTVLAERDDPRLPTLLPPGTRWLPLVARRDLDRADVRLAGRRLELILDKLGSAQSLARRFLDPALRGLLSDADQALARALDGMLMHLPQRARGGEAWRAFEAWLSARGHTQD